MLQRFQKFKGESIAAAIEYGEGAKFPVLDSDEIVGLLLFVAGVAVFVISYLR
jgi:hypothetical protein